MLFCMHHVSTPRVVPRILGYTSTIRRRHLGRKKYLGFIKRSKLRSGNSAQLKEAELHLSHFDVRSISPNRFDHCIKERGVAFNILGLFYGDMCSGSREGALRLAHKENIPNWKKFWRIHWSESNVSCRQHQYPKREIPSLNTGSWTQVRTSTTRVEGIAY